MLPGATHRLSARDGAGKTVLGKRCWENGAGKTAVRRNGIDSMQNRLGWGRSPRNKHPSQKRDLTRRRDEVEHRVTPDVQISAYAMLRLQKKYPTQHPKARINSLKRERTESDRQEDNNC